MVTRRDFLATFAAAAAGVALRPSVARAADAPRSRLGLVSLCCSHRRGWLKARNPADDLFAPRRFLDHCLSVGAGGMQLSLGAMPPQSAEALRQKAEQAGVFIEAMIAVPKEDGEIARFDAELETAARVGAAAARTTIIPGRRYEEFATLADYRAAAERGRRALERAAPIAEKHRVPLAVENHKDQCLEERVALLRHIDSEYVGACVDTGNSIALLEDPLETVQGLAPWAHSVHLKDQAVAPCDEGFLLGDIPLGEGYIDLKSIVEVLRAAKPGIHFSLELLTRDPLKVPVLTDRYWGTFPDRPAADLARMLRTVRDHTATNLQTVSGRPAEEQVSLEDSNVAKSLQYARTSLGL
jgi:sugar phosphate isomerase/epimerase